MNMTDGNSKPLYYSDYIELDKILNSQHPRSFLLPHRADDEMLFIIVHQTYELWFKQIIFELDLVRAIFAQKRINDNSPDMSTAVHKLKRVGKILELLIQQFRVLETMLPLDFLEFRSLLVPASGFQSKQFRLIEAKLGLKMGYRYMAHYYKHTNRGGFSQTDLDGINTVEREETLKDSIVEWLERMPFFDERFWGEYEAIRGPEAEARHPFWIDYRKAYRDSLADDEEGGMGRFDEVFFEKGVGDFFPRAMRAALFIMLYRNLPVFQRPFELLNSLIEIDELLSDWRYRHLLMVRRMIGMRVGTGGTKGASYLEGTLSRHFVFKELTEITTFIVARSRLPKIPRTLMEKLSFSS
jgi:tryptophan 2,3-dioxygenase